MDLTKVVARYQRNRRFTPTQVRAVIRCFGRCELGELFAHNLGLSDVYSSKLTLVCRTEALSGPVPPVLP